MLSKTNLSVIIPTYNAEDTISSCLLSVLSQKVHSMEVLVIDDGSTDNTAEIVQRLARIDNRIKYIHQQNSGVACARQVGIDNATGEYIINVDSDDIVLPNAYTKMLQYANSNNADIVIGSYRTGSIDSFQEIKLPEISSSSCFVNAILKNKVHGALWNKMIRKKCFANHEFVSGLNFMEDVLILIKILTSSPYRIVVLNETPVYHYIQRTESYTNNLSHKYLAQGKTVIENISELIGGDIQFSEAILNFKLYHRLLWILNANTRKIDVNNIFPEASKHIIKCNLSLPYKILLASEYIGTHLISDFYKVLKISLRIVPKKQNIS